jgi:hypothetical protein
MAHIPYIGGKITEPGIYARVPMVRYHDADICDGPSISSSGLRKIIHKSEAHYWCDSPLNPNRVGTDDEKEHFILGRAVHHLILGEPFFAKLFVIQPDMYDSGKEEKGKQRWRPWFNGAGKCKEWNAEQARAGKTILTADQVDHIRGMALSLGQNPLVRAGILNGAIERSMFWKDKESGIWLKARPDAIPNDSLDFSDLKTTTSVRYEDLVSTIAKFAYYQQGALIGEGCRRLLGQEMNSFSLVFVESKPPYATRVVQLDPDDLKRGHELNRQALARFWRCLRNQEWPGPGGVQHDAQSISLSQRARENLDAIVQHGSIS